MAKIGSAALEFPDIVYNTVTESAAGTLTFGKYETGHGTLDRVGWIVHRVENFIVNPTDLDAINDQLEIALVSSNQISALGLESAAVKHYARVKLIVFSSVGIYYHYQPFIQDFTSLPGGGLLMLPNPLWLAIKGTAGTANPITVKQRLYFTAIELGDQQWVQLVEATRLLS